MGEVNTIVGYKLTDEQVKCIENICMDLEEKIIVENTNIPQDIVAMPAFLVLANLENDDNKEFVLKNLKDIEEYINYSIIDKNTFKNKVEFKKKIVDSYYDYIKKSNEANSMF